MKTWNALSLPPLGLLLRYGGPVRWAAAALALAGAALAPWSPWAAAGCGAALLALLAFFRCPAAHPPLANGVLSAADGLVDDLGEEAEFRGRPGPWLRIGVFLSVLDVHVTRAPVAGRLDEKEFVPGRFGNALRRESGRRNQRHEAVFTDQGGRSIGLRQISGAIARRVILEPEPGDGVAAGALIGMIRFGSRTDVLIPLAAAPELRVALGDKVRAGESLLAVFTKTGLAHREG